eukprot:GHRQ01033979.1.p1 GENE.GHRQ01033979.1~~GHRQ01033979.1.p1  ORF type:complete len:114 (+),score=19.94 GHRQ01033979.1:282-623(+)
MYCTSSRRALQIMLGMQCTNSRRALPIKQVRTAQQAGTQCTARSTASRQPLTCMPLAPLSPCRCHRFCSCRQRLHVCRQQQLDHIKVAAKGSQMQRGVAAAHLPLTIKESTKR